MPTPNHPSWRSSGGNRKRYHQGQHRFEHWYRDNQVYFITVKTRDGYPAFATPEARQVFWDQFDAYCETSGFVPFVTSLMTNHYHTLGYLKTGENLPKLMKGVNGSVAKLVNDLLPERRRPFWYENNKQTYFDGCIRDEIQYLRAYRYVLTQCRRHLICDDWRDYPDTVVRVEMERALKRAVELKAFLYGVGYKRYREG